MPALYPKSGRPSDLEGPHGAAWRVQHRPESYTKPDHHATIATWVLHVPGAHPFWTFYALALWHLRDMPGVKPAQITLAGATHELMICSLDPEKSPPELEALEAGGAIPWLSPIDVVQQFIVRDDAEALRLGELAVRSIVDGIISPDQDYRRAWCTVITETARHLRTDVHGTQRKH